MAAAAAAAAPAQPSSVAFAPGGPSYATPTLGSARAGVGFSVLTSSLTPASTSANTPVAGDFVAREPFSLREGELQRRESELANREQLASSVLAPAGTSGVLPHSALTAYEQPHGMRLIGRIETADRLPYCSSSVMLVSADAEARAQDSPWCCVSVPFPSPQLERCDGCSTKRPSLRSPERLTGGRGR